MAFPAAKSSRPVPARNRNRRWTYAAVVLLAALAYTVHSVLYSPPRRNSAYHADVDATRKSPHIDAVTQRGKGCSSASLFERRNEPSFWAVGVVAGVEPRIQVSPVDADYYYNCPSLAHAMFSVWLDYDSETRHVATAPAQSPMGVYTFAVLPEPLLPQETTSPSAEVRVRLEFGFWPGGEIGQPCNAIECQPDHLAHIGIKFSGEEILDRNHTRLRVQWRSLPSTSRVSEESLDHCTNLDPLPVAYVPATQSFAFSDGKGSRCRTRSAGDLLPFRPPLRWIQVHGDSNCRYLIFELAEMLGLHEVIIHIEPEHSNLATTAVCHDGTGTGIVLVYRWLFLEHWPSDVNFLDAVRLSSLKAFLDSIPFPAGTTWPASFDDPDLRPTDLFISFGSHAQRLFTKGYVAAIDRLHPGLSRVMELARSTYFLLVAAAEPSEVPKKYAGDEIVRHNRMLELQNDLARAYFHSQSPKTTIIDFYSMTRTLPFELRIDSVHFHPGVYRTQADLMWTAMYAADEQQQQQHPPA